MKEQRWSVNGKQRQQLANERSREKGKTELRLSVEVLQRTRTLGQEKCSGVLPGREYRYRRGLEFSEGKRR